MHNNTPQTKQPRRKGKILRNIQATNADQEEIENILYIDQY